MKFFLSLLPLVVPVFSAPECVAARLQAGAAVVDVTPARLPVLVNGGMLSRTIGEVKTPLSARAIVLDDGNQRLAIAVVDSCMMPREFVDEAKQLAAQRTEIEPERMLISATHTHSAPSCMGALGTDPDPTYVPFLREKIAEAIATAEDNLEPARVGWAVTDAAEYTALRRWIRRPDRLANDPFGNPTVRANMHAGRNWDDVTGESGPEDPDLSMISFQSVSGRPIALLANFSMHYFSGERGLSADYFGLFCKGLSDHLEKKTERNKSPFVGIMSHGCSGDIWRRDYKLPAEARPDWAIEQYAAGLLKLALAAYAEIEYRDRAELAMAEVRLPLKYRVPDAQRLKWAREVVEAMGDRPPRNTPEVYAREQVILHELQSTEVVVQALRIGDVGIATTPNETYALTGLKIKLQSPLPKTMVIELANGGDGYIPPPEQHFLGGYNTWAARSAGLEVQAEPKITEAAISLLEKVAEKPRRPFQPSRGPASQAILERKPVAYWRLDDFAAPAATDSSPHQRDAVYEPGVVFFLKGPRRDLFCLGDQLNRAAHFAGGRLRARIADVGASYSVSLWCWNGMPTDAREVAGWMFSRGREYGLGPLGDHLGVGGTSHPGKLVFLHHGDLIAGRTALKRWSWNNVTFVRDGDRIRIHLNGNAQPEIELDSPAGVSAEFDDWFFGGRCDNESNWEGRLDEIAVFDRALPPVEIEQLLE